MNKIILVGKAASGKDYFKSFLKEKGLYPSVSHTTRPRRRGEIDGVDYFFVDDDVFNEMVEKNEFFEHKEFNGWKYGTSKTSQGISDVFIFTPGGIMNLPLGFLKKTTIVYFDIPEDVRVDRLIDRSDSDSIERRILADREDFRNFATYDYKITDPEFDCEEVFNLITK